MQTVLEVLQKCEGYFASKGVPSPKLDAQMLLARALGCGRLELFLRFDQPLDEKTLAPFREMARRRAKREPLQHILGDVEFFGVKLKSDARALVPRPETEELAEFVAGKLFPDADSPLNILDLGTGSGALAISLAGHFKNAQVVGVDLSDAALELARENLSFVQSGNENFSNLDSRVKFAKSDWFANVEGVFDLIVANPPYLTEAEYAEAQAEVKDFDPYSALVSPEEGMCDLKKILSIAPKFLKPNGAIICECGIAQPPLLADFARAFFASAEWLEDSSHRPRFVVCRK